MLMVPKQDPRSKAERAHAILCAAQRIFAKDGFALATMASIAQEAGVSKGGLYRHLASKDELFLTLALTALRQLDELLSPTLKDDSQPGFAALVTCIRQTLAYVADDAEKVKFAMACSSVREYLDPACPLLVDYDAEVSAMAGAVVAMLVRGQADGSVRSDVEAACLAASVWGSLLGVLRFSQLGAELTRRVPLATSSHHDHLVELVALSVKSKP